MKVLVLGANGQLGSDIVRLWRDPGVEVVAATRADADVTNFGAIEALVQRTRPDAVINTTAYHNVNQAEAEPLLCFDVNVGGGWNIARACQAAGAALVQISTDYVFDGEKASPYLEDDARRAANIYGAAKLATEDVVRQVCDRVLIARVSGLYGIAGSAGKGGNFVETMLRLAAEGRPIRVVSDQATSPTNTAEIAEALLPLVRDGCAGTVHLAAGEGCSWYEFAAAVFKGCGLSPEFSPQTTAESGTPVKRPAYSVMGTTRAPAMRHWQDGLARYLQEKGHSRG